MIVCAGGPSLTGFDFARLAGKNVIAINRALEFVPAATVLWWSDARFWFNHQEKILAHAARWKATAGVNYGSEVLPGHIHQYRVTGHKGFDPAPDAVRSGNNSAYAAMHLSAHLGARKIIALGLDMKHGPKGESHFHGGHGFQHQEATLTDLMIPWFKTLAPHLAERQIEVFNASRDSALTVWRRCSIDEGLAEYDRG